MEMNDGLIEVEQSSADLLGRGWNDPVLQRLLKVWPDRPYIDGGSIRSRQSRCGERGAEFFVGGGRRFWQFFGLQGFKLPL